MSTWITVRPGLPAPITNLADTLRSLLDALLAILSIAQAILNIAKTFLIGLLDPLAAIIQALLNEIESLLADLRQLGVYMSGDLILKYPFQEVRGGYVAYERRMIARLVDRTDPTRPDFTSRSGVLAVFLYASFDVTTIEQGLLLIRRIKEFFGLRDGEDRPFTAPIGLEVAFGTSEAGIGAFGRLLDQPTTAPLVANVRWRMAPPPNTGHVAWPLPGPRGFLVEVSTVRDGLLLGYSAPPLAAGPPNDEQGGPQNRTFGVVLDPDGRPFRLFGGADMLNTTDLEWKGGPAYNPPDVAGGAVKGGGVRLMAYRSATDTVGIPVNALRTPSGDHLLQRAFFVDARAVLGVSAVTPGQPYMVNLRYEDMPYEADVSLESNGGVRVEPSDQRARTVYVRVSAVSGEVVGTNNPLQPTTFRYVIGEADVTAGVAQGQVRLRIGNPLSNADRGPTSAPLIVTFPQTATEEYLRTVATALAIVVLSRADLHVARFGEDVLDAEEAASSARVAAEAAFASAAAVASAEGSEMQQDQANSAASQALAALNEAEAMLFHARRSAWQPDAAALPTGLEDVASYLLPQITGRNPARYFQRADVSPPDFRRRLYSAVRAMAQELLSRTGPLPPSVEQYVLEQSRVNVGGVIRPLAEVRWAHLDPFFGVEATLLESLDTSKEAGADTRAGVGLNPLSIGLEEFAASTLVASTPLPRRPGFLDSPDAGDTDTAPVGQGSADMSPVLYTRRGPLRVAFCRNLFHGAPDVLTAAALVLNVASAPMSMRPRGGEWVHFRLFPGGLPPVQAVLDEILGFLRSIQAGTKAITDLIKAYIGFLEARILELEAIIRRIRALLDAILLLQVPTASGLVVTAQGTGGILQELVTADNKPLDSSASFGVGVCLLAGGLPMVLLDLLRLLFIEEN